jgi:hypothetical protein
LLRGLTIFLVLMNHVNMRLRFAKAPYTDGFPQQLVKSLFWNGQFGVQMFFAVFRLSRRTGHASTLGLSLPGQRALVLPASTLVHCTAALLLLLAVLGALHFANVHNFVVPAGSGGLGRALLAMSVPHVSSSVC